MTRIKQATRRHWWWVLSVAFVALGLILLFHDSGGNRVFGQEEGPMCPDCAGQPDGNDCCGGTPAPDCPTPSGNYSCCNGVWYNVTTQGCCGGQVYDLATMACCIEQVYDPASQTCCGGNTVTDGVNACCINDEAQCCCQTQCQ